MGNFLTGVPSANVVKNEGHVITMLTHQTVCQMPKCITPLLYAQDMLQPITSARTRADQENEICMCRPVCPGMTHSEEIIWT